MYDSSDSGQGYSYVMLTGDTGIDPAVVASFCAGANGESAGPAEYAIEAPGAAAISRGRLTWDASHGALGDRPFFSVAPVRLEITREECRWSAGTSPYIRVPAPSFESIGAVQVVARVGRDIPGRLVRWDLLEITFIRADGSSVPCPSHCLPRAETPQQVRRSVFAQDEKAPAKVQQIAEIRAGADIVAIHVRGQVTLGANPPGEASTLQGDDLQGAILVFTRPTRKEQDESGPREDETCSTP